jgi:hypothetical protein
LFLRTGGLDEALPEPDERLSTHPALHRARALSKIEIDNRHYPKTILNPGGIATVVLRLVNGFTVSLGGHYSTDYYDHSAPHHD